MQKISKNATFLRPQAGKQTEFLSSGVDFCLYGGGAGGGKTYGIILEGLRYHTLKDARVLVLRRQSKDIDQPGGLWDTMSNIYGQCGAESNKSAHRFTFPSGMQLTLSHLNTEQDKYNFQGAQELASILFDELTHFTETQFWYMFSRCRNTYGVRPYVRATCNPEPGWVCDFIRWYIGDDGIALPNRACAIRYFVRDGDNTIWGNSQSEVVSLSGCHEDDVKSFQFIPATIEDNQILMTNNGREYISSIKLTGAVEAERLLHGNWFVKKEGKLFKASDFMVFTVQPADFTCKIITMDTAQKTGEHNDFSVMQCWIFRQNKIYLIDQARGKLEAPELEIMAESFVNKHRDRLKAVFIEDKVSGTGLIQKLKRVISVPVLDIQRSRDKYTRALDAQSYISAGFVFVNPLMGYYTDFIAEMVAFDGTGSGHDDQCDCCFDAIDKLLVSPFRGDLQNTDAVKDDGVYGSLIA